MEDGLLAAAVPPEGHAGPVRFGDGTLIGLVVTPANTCGGFQQSGLGAGHSLHSKGHVSWSILHAGYSNSHGGPSSALGFCTRLSRVSQLPQAAPSEDLANHKAMPHGCSRHPSGTWALYDSWSAIYKPSDGAATMRQQTRLRTILRNRSSRPRTNRSRGGAYAGGRRIADIPIDEAEAWSKKQDHARTRAGNCCIASRPNFILSSRDRGRIKRPSEAQGRAVRRRAVRRGADRANGGRPHCLWRDAYFRRSQLRGAGPPRRVDILQGGP